MLSLLRNVLTAAALLTLSPCAQAAIQSGSIDVHWNEGAEDCKAHPQPPLQVHAYNAQTFILRENLCSTFEAPFMYLLVGSTRALLIDTGDVADPGPMPLAATVARLVPAGLPLLVVHTHRHLDHRAGDPQFASLPNVQVVGYDIDSVRRFYHFEHWPDGIGRIDLGGRVVDVLPTPGHEATHVAFYDRNTALFFSGDFMLPGRLLIADDAAALASARRVADFVRNRPVAWVLGGHIEEDVHGNLFDWGSQHHPGEHRLAMSRSDLLALPAALNRFNGFYSTVGQFPIMNSMHNLIAAAGAIVAVLVGLVASALWYVRRRRRRKTLNAS